MIGEMVELNEPQVWTLIAVFAASMFGMLRMTSKTFADLLRAEIGGLRAEMGSEVGGLRAEMRSEIGGLRAEMRSEIGGLRAEMKARFDAQDAKVDAQNVKLDHLDRDVRALVRRVFPEYPEAG